MKGAVVVGARGRVIELAARMRPRVGRPVDAMQVAAALEADGITERSVGDYGFSDVFDLADAVFARLDVPVPADEGRAPTGAERIRALRDISHGLVYLLPSVLLPVALALVGRHRFAIALIAASGLGWVWSAGSAWLVYRLIGRGLPISAGRVLRWAALGGAALGALTGLVIMAWTGGSIWLIGIVAALLAFQMASTIALIYRREIWLVVAMAPGVGAGLANIFSDRTSTMAVAAVGAASILAALVLAVWLTTPTRSAGTGRAGATATEPAPAAPASIAPAAAEPAMHGTVRPELAQLCGVLTYAAMSAGFLLHVDGRYLAGGLGLAVTAAPLIVGMGLVEWRVRRFHERARELLAEVDHPRQFAAAVWRRLTAELLGVLGMIAALAVVTLAMLRQADLLTPAVATLMLAHVAVSGAYFLAFIVAGQALYGRLTAALAVALLAHLVVLRLLPGEFSPLKDGAVFLGSALLLQALLVTILTRVLGQAWRYR